MGSEIEIIGEDEAALLADYNRRYPTEASSDGVVWWYTGDEPKGCMHGLPFDYPCNQCNRNAERYQRAERMAALDELEGRA